MNTARRGLVAVLLLTTLAATACRPDTDRSYELQVGGCQTASTRSVSTTTARVLDVTADGCDTTTNPTYRAAFSARLFVSEDIRSVRIRTRGPASEPTVISRADLERQFGPIPRREPGTPLVLLLPVALFAYAGLMFVVARCALRAGVVVVMPRQPR